METPDVKILNSQEYVYLSNYIYLILGMFRPGALTFLTRLEYEYFPPSDPKNDLFTVHVAKYEGNIYSIIGIPMEYLDTCKELAQNIELQLINGVPISAKQCSVSNECESRAAFNNNFPISHSQDLTYTLQNIKTLNPKEISDLLRKEWVQVQKYVSKKL